MVGITFSHGKERRPRARNGDNGPATEAEINDPDAIALVGSKTLYIAENGNVIRRVDLKSGIITTFQTKTKLEAINSLAVDASGSLIAAEFTMDRVRRIDPVSGSVTTIAGGIRLAFSGDGGPALEAGLEYPNSVAVDRDGNLFIAQYGYGQDANRIRRVDAKTGIITTIAGSGKGFAFDGVPALSVSLSAPCCLFIDWIGNIYFVEDNRVRRIEAVSQNTGTVAGSIGFGGFGGDGGPALRARLDNPATIAIDSDGNLYIADYANHRIRRVDARTGIIGTVAGNGFPHHVHILL